MSLTRIIVVAALGLAVFATQAQAAKPKKKNQTFKGTVTEVAKKDTDSTTLTVLLQVRKKDKGTVERPEKKFTLTKDTKFEQVSGKKDAVETKPGTLADVKKDVQVAIETTTDQTTAAKVAVLAKKKVKTN
jgi:hypothetical protein